MDKTNKQIIAALEELNALRDSLLRRSMSDEIDEQIPRLVNALRVTHQWLKNNVPEKGSLS